MLDFRVRQWAIFYSLCTLSFDLSCNVYSAGATKQSKAAASPGGSDRLRRGGADVDFRGLEGVARRRWAAGIHGQRGLSLVDCGMGQSTILDSRLCSQSQMERGSTFSRAKDGLDGQQTGEQSGKKAGENGRENVGKEAPMAPEQ